MAQKIKLVQIIADSSLGGGPRHVLGLIKNIDKSVFDVFVICPSGYLSAEAKQIKGVVVFNLPMRSKFDLKAIFKIKKIINDIRTSVNPFGPLIVHTHGSRAGLLGRLASPFHAKKVYTEHRFDEEFHLKNPLNEWIQKRMLSAQNHRSDLIIAVSSSVKKYLIESKMAPKDRIVIIPNGINLRDSKTEDRRPARSTGSVLRAPVIGNIGNLNFQKGQVYLVQAMTEVLKKYPLATLEIIGEGEERKILEAEIKKLKLGSHVTLLGSKNVVDKYLKHWSVFVSASIAETFGIVILEAMKYGLPIVATRVGGVPDIITQRKNGILVESESPKALARGVIEVLESPALAAKLKRGGLERVRDFDWKNIIKSIEKQYITLFE